MPSITIAEVSFNNDRLALHLCELYVVSDSTVRERPTFVSYEPTGCKDGFSNRGHILELGSRVLLIRAVPTISCAILVSDAVSYDPGVFLVLVGHLVLDDGVLPRIFVE